MMSRILVLFSVIALMAAGSCNVINPAEPVPTYVHLDSFIFSGSPAFGSSSHDIKTVYVYLNNQTVGTFDLPCTVPILMDKPGVLLVTPGIYMNGLSGYTTQYPFYRSDTVTISPSPGQVLRPAIRTNYFAFARVLEPKMDFETGLGFTNLSGNVGITRTTLPGEVFEGSASGIIRFTGSHDSSENVNDADFAIPANTEAYLELDYKCTEPFTVGMYTASSGIPRNQYLVGFYPSATWKKAYVPLRAFVSTYQPSAGRPPAYNILIKAVKTSTLAEGYVLLDNLKIVTF